MDISGIELQITAGGEKEYVKRQQSDNIKRKSSFFGKRFLSIEFSKI